MEAEIIAQSSSKLVETSLRIVWLIDAPLRKRLILKKNWKIDQEFLNEHKKLWRKF